VASGQGGGVVNHAAFIPLLALAESLKEACHLPPLRAGQCQRKSGCEKEGTHRFSLDGMPDAVCCDDHHDELKPVMDIIGAKSERVKKAGKS
jgi:hypothetical protein